MSFVLRAGNRALYVSHCENIIPVSCLRFGLVRSGPVRFEAPSSVSVRSDLTVFSRDSSTVGAVMVKCCWLRTAWPTLRTQSASSGTQTSTGTEQLRQSFELSKAQRRLIIATKSTRRRAGLGGDGGGGGSSSGQRCLELDK